MITDSEYLEYSEVVYKYLLSLTRDADLAEEITQETFYQAVKSTDSFDGTCKITTWLCAIAKNCLYKYFRKNPRREELDAEQPDYNSLEEDFIRKEDSLEVLRSIHALNDDVRELMHLRILGGLSFRRIGEIMGKSENWARVTFYRGKEKLKKEMNRYER